MKQTHGIKCPVCKKGGFYLNLTNKILSYGVCSYCCVKPPEKWLNDSKKSWKKLKFMEYPFESRPFEEYIPPLMYNPGLWGELMDEESKRMRDKYTHDPNPEEMKMFVCEVIQQ